MEENIPVLCGGTFFTLLLQAKKQSVAAAERIRGESNAFTEPKVLLGLIKVINPDYKEPTRGDTFGTITSQFKCCKKLKFSGYLPFTDDAIIKDFDNRIQNNYHELLKTMREFTDCFIDTSTIGRKDVQLVKALLELIKLDKSIKAEDKFYTLQNGCPETKAELVKGLPNLCELCIYLPALILGIWHFIVVNREDNTIGQATYNSWHNVPLNKRGKRKYIGTIGSNVKCTIELISADEVTEESGDIPATPLNNAPQIHNFANDSESMKDTNGNIPAKVANLPPTIILRHYLFETHKKIFGRKNELEQIEYILKKYTYAIFTGIGGVGKTRIALEYAYELNANHDWIIQLVHCKDCQSLRNAIERLEIYGLEDSANNPRYDEIVNALKYYRKPSLIILDNLEQPFTPDDYDDFIKLTNECGQYIKFIITSREAELLGVKDELHTLEIEPLDEEMLLELYASYHVKGIDNCKIYIDTHREVLIEIFRMVNSHTLMIELLVQLKMPPITLHEKLLQEGIDISPDKTLTIVKDAERIEMNIKNTIMKIFNMSKLNHIEKNIMRHAALLHQGGMELQLFKEISGCATDAAISRLENSNWINIEEDIEKGSERISLHPLISETILNMEEIQPTYETCNMFFERLMSIYDNSEQLAIPESKNNEQDDFSQTLSCAIRKSTECDSTLNPILERRKDFINTASHVLRKINFNTSINGIICKNNLKRILCTTMNVIFEPIKEIIPYLKDEYQAALLFLYETGNKSLKPEPEKEIP